MLNRYIVDTESVYIDIRIGYTLFLYKIGTNNMIYRKQGYSTDFTPITGCLHTAIEEVTKELTKFATNEFLAKL